MPYVAPEDRHWSLPDPGNAPHTIALAIRTWIMGDAGHAVPSTAVRTDGEIVWGICKIADTYAARQPRCFQTWFDCLYALELLDEGAGPWVRAVLEAARLEFYRRVIAPYEDLARLRNGEVFSPEILPLDGQYA